MNNFQDENLEWYECSVCCYSTNREYKLWKHVEEEHNELNEKQNIAVQLNKEGL